MADLHTPLRTDMPVNQDVSDNRLPDGPNVPYRHASIAETQNPDIGTVEQHRHHDGSSPTRDPNDLLLASDIPLHVWRDLLLGGAYEPNDTQERFNWMGAVTAAGAGVVSIPVPPVPAGQDWLIEAITYSAITAAAQACARIDSTTDPASIIDVASVMVNVGGQFATRSIFNLPEYVPQGRQLFIQFNAPGADTYFTRIRYTLRQGDPVKQN